MTEWLILAIQTTLVLYFITPALGGNLRHTLVLTEKENVRHRLVITIENGPHANNNQRKHNSHASNNHRKRKGLVILKENAIHALRMITKTVTITHSWKKTESSRQKTLSGY